MARAGWAARAISRSWKARLSGTSASRSCCGAGSADLEHAVREVVELGDVGGGGVRDGEAGELRLEGGAQVEDALELGDGPGGDAGAAVGHDLDQALGGEPGQRLADRGAADAQPLGELDLTQPGPGRELRAQDQLAQRLAAPARPT